MAGIVGNSIFGFSFLFSKIALKYVSPIVLLSVRFDIAFLTMLVLALLHVIPVHLKGKDIKPLIILGILQPIIYFICENNGLLHASSSIAGVIIAVIPVVSFFTGLVMLHEKFEMKQLFWAIVSLGGVSIISMLGSSEGNLEVLGLALLFGAVFAGAFFNTFSRRIADAYTSTERTFVMFFLGAVFFTFVAMIETKGSWFTVVGKSFAHKDFLVTMIYLGIISSIIAFYCLNYAVSYLPVRQATSFASLTSIISVLAGVFILHEHISKWQGVAIIMILFGVYKVNQIAEK